MKKDFPRLVPIWLLPLLLLIALCMIQCGCRTGGKTLRTNSSGIESVITSSNLIRQPNGTYKTEPMAEQAKFPPTRSRPKPLPAVSVEPTDVPPISGVGKPTPFEPTTSSSANQKLGPINPRVNVLPQTNHTVDVILPEEPQQQNNNKVKVDWWGLIVFYAACAVAFVVLWLVVDIGKNHFKK
jgi:hypothetical protein